MINNDMEYIQACTEVNCLLKYFPKEYIEKIPDKLLNMFKTKSNEKYNIVVDIEKDLKSQNISKEAKDILVVLKYNYWSDDIEKEHLKENFYKNEKIFQEELSSIYNTDKLFKNKEKSIVELVEYKPKESFLTKILNKIKLIFNRK